MRKILAILTLGLILALPLQSHAEQLLANPNFEEGGFKSWAITYNPNNWTVVNSPDHRKVARCYWDGGLKQLVPITAGKNYELVGNIYVPEGGDREGWGCWFSLDWYDKDKNKIGTAWSVTPHESERGKWNNFNSDRCIAPKGAAFVCVDFGVWQNDTNTPANPIDFGNLLLKER